GAHVRSTQSRSSERQAAHYHKVHARMPRIITMRLRCAPHTPKGHYVLIDPKEIDDLNSKPNIRLTCGSSWMRTKSTAVGRSLITSCQMVTKQMRDKCKAASR